MTSPASPRNSRRFLNWFRRPHHAAERRPTRRLQVEHLEDRNLLSAPGTWAALTNLAPTQIGSMHLLTDGTVIAQGDLPGVNSVTNLWDKLTPDSSGSYQNGTWSSAASMSSTRLYFGSNVLPSGKLFVQGGEYSSAGSFTRTGETYDPATNTWSNHANALTSLFGDDPTMLLPTGKVLGGYISGPQTYLYTPSTDSWAATGTKLRGDQSDEETWVLLPASSAHPQGAVLSYDVFGSVGAGANRAQIYDVASGTWSDSPFPSTFLTPLLTSPNIGYELGPAELLPDGRVFQIGALQHTAFYDTKTGTWSKGPDIPGNYGADDAPSAILPDGHVIFLADAGPFRGTFSPPTHMFDFDPTTDTITDITSTLPATLQSQLAGQSSYQARMLVLPSGQLLLAPDNQGGGGNKLYIFTPSDSPDPTWQPTIYDITYNGNQTFTLTGAQLNGISQGSSYGDDAESDTNYPIVQLTDLSGGVHYAKTTNWTPGVSAVGDTTSQTVTFTLPKGLAAGDYLVSTIANGISSFPVYLSVASGQAPDVAGGPAALTSGGDGTSGSQTPARFGHGLTPSAEGGGGAEAASAGDVGTGSSFVGDTVATSAPTTGVTGTTGPTFVVTNGGTSGTTTGGDQTSSGLVGGTTDTFVFNVNGNQSAPTTGQTGPVSDSSGTTGGLGAFSTSVTGYTGKTAVTDNTDATNLSAHATDSHALLADPIDTSTVDQPL